MLRFRDIQVEMGPSSKLRKALPKLVLFLFTGFLAAGFMLVAGCGNNPKSEEQQPIEPASEQSTVLDDYEIIDGDKFFAKPQKPVKSKEHGGPSIETENTEKKAIVNTFSEVLYYGIELDLSEEFLQIIDELHKNEAGELVQYPFYKIAEKNHLDYKEKGYCLG